MERGWIPLWRKSMDSKQFAKSEVWHVWTKILFGMNFKKTYANIGGTVVEIEPGQLIFGRNTWGDELGIHPSTVYRIVSCFASEEYGNAITIKSNNRFSVISVNNWESYRPSSVQDEQVMNNWRTTGEQLVNTPNNDKNDKNVKKDQTLFAVPDGTTVKVSPYKESADKIVRHYEKEVRDDRDSRYRAKKNVEALLRKGGFTKEVLWECVNLYANSADAKDPQFRKVAGNFFGRDSVFRNYTDEAKRIVEVEYAAKR